MKTNTELIKLFKAMSQDDYEKLNEAFDEWFYGGQPKRRFTYYLKKLNLTTDEYFHYFYEM